MMNTASPQGNKRLPEWLLNKKHSSQNIHKVKSQLRQCHLHTVCEEARCPNIGECFKRGTATFLIMGNICTRNCQFCNVTTGIPDQLDPLEPARIAEMAAKLKLRHVVITSVTRDDLEDGGAGHFIKTIMAIKTKTPVTTIEVLVPDFEGSKDSIKSICDAGPDIFNHNIETVARLTPIVRNKAAYATSLGVLKYARGIRSKMKVKSGLMVGLGEDKQEVKETLKDLFNVGCDIVTIGQYLQPNKQRLKVKEFVEPKVFNEYKEYGESLGIKSVFSGPLVRSSYLADQFATTVRSEECLV